VINNTQTVVLCGTAVNFIITSFHLISTSMETGHPLPSHPPPAEDPGSPEVREGSSPPAVSRPAASHEKERFCFALFRLTGWSLSSPLTDPGLHLAHLLLENSNKASSGARRVKRIVSSIPTPRRWDAQGLLQGEVLLTRQRWRKTVTVSAWGLESNESDC